MIKIGLIQSHSKHLKKSADYNLPYDNCKKISRYIYTGSAQQTADYNRSNIRTSNLFCLLWRYMKLIMTIYEVAMEHLFSCNKILRWTKCDFYRFLIYQFFTTEEETHSPEFEVGNNFRSYFYSRHQYTL